MSVYGGFTVEERLQKWKEILGIDDCEEGARFEKVTREETLKNSKTRVINQDVLRTRADEPFFKSSMVKAVLKQTLIRFCSYHRIEYMQGLNEILAPILTLDVELTRTIEERGVPLASSSNDSADGDGATNITHPFGLHLLIFERMMTKLSPTTFSTRGVDAIQVQLTTFHLLLMYHEPVLATILRKEGMTPDIFAMSWLITLFARRQPVQRALHIWDMLLQMDAPYLCVFLSVALIRSRRDRILNDCADVLPETLVSLKFESDEEIDIVFADALQLVQSTPATITTELMKLGFDNQIDERAREKGLKDLWHRPCVISSAAEVAHHIAQQAEAPPNNSDTHRPPPRYLVLDCRHTVEQQLLDAHYIEGSVSVPHAVQDEVCALARHKSGLLEHGEMDMEMDLSNATDPADVERSFAKVVAQLSTRTAAVLALLWAAFVTGTTEEVHFAIADDSTGPYSCQSDQKSPLETSYPLPYHTASGASDDIPLRERTFSETTENLPQYLTNSHATLSNTNAMSFASALIILGFPRVSIVQGEVIFKDSMSNENLLFSCTENNSFSSLPVMKSEQRSSGFTCLVHYLGAYGVNTGTINARYSHIQVPIDHFKEYQVAAFVHELRASVIHSDTIDADYYAHSEEHLASAETPPHANKGATASHHGTPLSIVAAVMSVASTSAAAAPHHADGHHPHGHIHEKHKHGHQSHTHKHVSSKSTLSSSISSALSALTPGVTPRSAKTVKHQTRETRVPSFASEPLIPFPQFSTGASGNNISAISMGGPSQTAGTESTSTSSTMMQAKLGCNLDNLYRLLLIMSAQKRQHITRLVVGSHFHSTVPLARSYSHSPAADEEADYARFLGTKPCGDGNLSDSKLSTASRTCSNHNLVYYEKLERLLTLRDTLQELVNTQRLNDVLDKTSTKMATKMRLLRSAIEQTNKHTRRSIAGLQRKTVLRSTQRRLQAEAEAAKRGGNGMDGADVADGEGGWQTVKDLSAFFRQQEDRHESQEGQEGQRSESRSSSVLRDSLSADGGWDRGSRLMSDDSIDVKLTASMSMSDLL